MTTGNYYVDKYYSDYDTIQQELADAGYQMEPAYANRAIVLAQELSRGLGKKHPKNLQEMLWIFKNTPKTSIMRMKGVGQGTIRAIDRMMEHNRRLEKLGGGLSKKEMHVLGLLVGYATRDDFCEVTGHNPVDIRHTIEEMIARFGGGWNEHKP